MDRNLVELLRRQIDTRYQEAIRALETVAAYLPQEGLTEHELPETIPGIQPFVSPMKSRNGSGTPRAKNKRQMVMKALFDLPGLTVQQLAELLHMAKGQVRGVLYAPSLAGKFRSELNDEGIARYFLTEAAKVGLA